MRRLFSVRAVERRLRRKGFLEDRRGRHTGSQRQANESMARRRALGLLRDDDRYGGACDCTRRALPPGTALPAVRVTGDDDGLVCTGCGVVVQNGIVLHPTTAGADDYSANNWHRKDITQYDDCDMRQSPPYNRNVHYAEFVALVTVRGPPVPDDDMARIEVLYDRWLAATHKPYEFCPIDLAVQDVREVLRPMTHIERRRYNERWLHIIRRLSGEDYFDRYGPRLLPATIANDMKRRFYYLNIEFQRLKDRQHWLFCRRKNIPYLMVVSRHLLYQSCASLQPQDASELGKQTLSEWRREMFQQYSWYFRSFDTKDAAILTEFRVGYLINRLWELFGGKGRHELNWVPYKCFLPPKDNHVRVYQPDKWRSILLRITRNQLHWKFRSAGHL